MLSPAQLAILKTDITVTRAAVMYEGRTIVQHWDNFAVGTLIPFYSQTATPAVPLWRPDVRRTELVRVLVGAEYTAGTLPADEIRRKLFDVITRDEPIDTTVPGVRANFVLAIGGASATLTAWSALAKQHATILEALFAGAPVGGASVSVVFGYRLTIDDLVAARALP